MGSLGVSRHSTRSGLSSILLISPPPQSCRVSLSLLALASRAVALSVATPGMSGQANMGMRQRTEPLEGGWRLLRNEAGDGCRNGQQVPTSPVRSSKVG